MHAVVFAMKDRLAAVRPSFSASQNVSVELRVKYAFISLHYVRSKADCFNENAITFKLSCGLIAYSTSSKSPVNKTKQLVENQDCVQD